MSLREYALDPLALSRPLSGSLSPVLRGEGWGEGPFSRGAHFPERPLTLTLSPEYRGEGTRKQRVLAQAHLVTRSVHHGGTETRRRHGLQTQSFANLKMYSILLKSNKNSTSGLENGIECRERLRVSVSPCFRGEPVFIFTFSRLALHTRSGSRPCRAGVVRLASTFGRRGRTTSSRASRCR